jgi:ATP synthase protein I
MRGDAREGRKRPSGMSLYVQAEKMLQIAVLLPAAAFVGWLAGAWLGGKLHQSWMGLAGILLGGIGGLVYVIRLVMVSGNHDSQASNDGDADKSAEPLKKP